MCPRFDWVVLGGLLTLGSAVLVHILTLPTEFDASFGRAMPMLEKHGIIYSADEMHARSLSGRRIPI